MSRSSGPAVGVVNRGRRWVGLVTTGAMIAVGLVAVSPGAVEPAYAASGTSIVGIVHADGKAGGIPDADVYLWDHYGRMSRSTTTDAYGWYEFDFLNSSYTYEMEFVPPETLRTDEGYVYQFWGEASGSTLITLDPGERFVADVSLHVGGTVSGRVTDATTGASVSGERVTVESVRSATTAADGSYTIKGLYPGDYRLSIDQVDSDGHVVPNPMYANEWWNGKRTQGSADSVTVGFGETVTANFATPRASSFSGRITDPNGSPLNGVAYVYGADPEDDGSLVATAYADSNGRWTAGGLLPGKYKIGIVGAEEIVVSVVGHGGAGGTTATYAGDVKVTTLSPGGGQAAKDLRSSYPYASQWYSGHTSFATAHTFTISKPDTHITGLDQQLPWDRSAIEGQTWSGELMGGWNPSEPLCPCSYGDPVNASSGEFFLNSTDLSEPGAGPAVQLTRSYSSANASNWGLFGIGTSSNLSMWLQPTDYVNDMATKVGVVQENGSVVWFTWNGAGYIAPTRVQATLTVNGDGAYVFTRGGTDRFTFGPDGYLISESDLNGNTVDYAYDDYGRPLGVSGSGGRRIDLTWTDEGFLTSAVDQAGRTVTYGYDQNGDLTSVTDPDGNVTSYGYDDAGQLITLTKPNGGTTTNTYSDGMVVVQTDPLGRVTSFSYEGASWDDMTTTITLPDGEQIVEVYSQGLLQSRTTAAGTSLAATTTHGYDDAHNLTSVTSAMGHTTRYSYDDSGNVTRVRQPLGQLTTYTYNDLRDVTSVTDPLGQTTTYTFDAAGNRTGQTAPDGATKSWLRSPDGTVSSYTDALGHVTTYTYDPAGRIASTTDPNRRTTTIGYNDAGQVTSTSTPSGATTSYTVDAAGHVLTVTTPAGRVTTSTYDGDGNLTRVADPAGRATRYKYDLADQRIQQVDSNHNVTGYAYDQAGRLAKVIAPGGGVIRYEYNLAGRQSGVIDPDGNRTATHYNLDGLVTAVYRPDGSHSTNAYDANGNMTSATDFNGNATSYAYDADGRLATTTDPLGRVTTIAYTPTGQTAQVTLPDGSAETYGYDRNGNPTKFTNPDGAITTYAYTLSGQLKSQTAPGGATTSYTYTVDGRLHTTTRPDGTTATHAYTLDGQLKNVHYSQLGSTDTTYTYTVSGRRKTMTDESGTTSYVYDAAGRLTSVTDGNGDTVGYGYDSDGNVTVLTYPDGRQATYEFDPAGRMTSVSDWGGNTTIFTWDPNGNLATQSYPNGLTETIDYDPNGNPTNITHATTSGTLASFDYGYDAASQLTSVSSIDPVGQTSYDYSYDLVGQLAAQTETAGNPVSYTATSGGRLTNLAGASLTYNDAGQVIQLASAPDAPLSFAYDANGRRTNITDGDWTSTQTYDAASNLATVGDSSLTVTYTSSGDGLRQSRTDGDGTQHFTWDTSRAVPLLLDDGQHAYVYGPGITPIAQIDDTTGEIQYLSADNIGSVRLITDADGNAVGGIDYDPYGQKTLAGSATSAIGYTGNWTDSDTGYVYLRARDYDPATGQFLTRDPLENLTANAYGYVDGNPLQHVDPLGLIDWPAVGMAAAIGAAVVVGGLCIASVICGVAAGAGAAGFGALELTVGVGTVLAAGTAGAAGGALVGLQAQGASLGFPSLQAPSLGANTWFNEAGNSANAGDESVCTDGSNATDALTSSERSTLNDALRSDKLDHIFAPKHNLDPLVEQFGSREGAMEQIVRSVRGSLPESGPFEVTRSLGGQQVTIRGAVVDGVPRIGTVFTP